jgi:hypothetical protein
LAGDARHHQFLESNPTIKPRKSSNSRWNTRRGPDHPPLLADLDPELPRLPLVIPVGILGNGGWETSPLALSYWEGAVGNRMRTSGEGQVK